MNKLSKEEKFNIYFLFYSLVIGILILVFSEFLVEYIPIFVSSVILIYSLELLIKWLVCDRKITKETKLFDGIIELLLSIIIIIFLRDKFEAICIVWGFWIVIREGKELDESIYEIKHNKLAIIDILESCVLMYFAISLIINPTEHHAFIHVILTGIEFIFNFCLYMLILFRKRKKQEVIEEE